MDKTGVTGVAATVIGTAVTILFPRKWVGWGLMVVGVGLLLHLLSDSIPVVDYAYGGLVVAALVFMAGRLSVKSSLSAVANTEQDHARRPESPPRGGAEAYGPKWRVRDVDGLVLPHGQKPAVAENHNQAALDAQQRSQGVQENGDLAGELLWELQKVPEGVRIVVTNDHVRDEPKKDITVRIDDLRRWAEKKGAYVADPAVVAAKPPLRLRMDGGSREIYFEKQQIYAFLQQTGNRGQLALNYEYNLGAFRQVELNKGTWRAKLTVAWQGREESRFVCFRFDAPRTTPEIVECPNAVTVS